MPSISAISSTRARTSAAPAALAHGIGEIVEGREMRVQREGLEDHRHAAALHGRMGHVLTRRTDPAGIRTLEPGDARKVVVLPAALGPRITKNSPAATSRSMPSSAHAAEALGQLANPQLGHLSSGRPARAIWHCASRHSGPHGRRLSAKRNTPAAADTCGVPVCAPWPGSAVARIFGNGGCMARGLDPLGASSAHEQARVPGTPCGRAARRVRRAQPAHRAGVLAQSGRGGRRDRLLGARPERVGRAFLELGAQAVRRSRAAGRGPVQLWRDQAELWQNTLQRMLGDGADRWSSPRGGDRRFKDEDWSSTSCSTTSSSRT